MSVNIMAARRRVSALAILPEASCMEVIIPLAAPGCQLLHESWSAQAMLALYVPEARLRAAGGRSTASPRESGSMAPALQTAKAQILDMSQTPCSRYFPKRESPW